ncbi:MAG: magnesium transporter [Gammaproteobacteria bacterium]|nr:magnesium transporter [Gammaproteobacteria bacterium]
MVTSSTSQADYLEQVLAALESESPERLNEVVDSLHPADIADVLEALPPSQRSQVWPQVRHENMGEVLAEVAEGVRPSLLEPLDEAVLVQAIGRLDTDDIADLIPDLPEEVVSRLLFVLDKNGRAQLDAVLAYPEDTAGGLMDVDVLTVREDITLGVAQRYLRKLGSIPADTNKLFVVDRKGYLTGVLYLSTLLTDDPGMRVSEAMKTDVVKFNVLSPDTDVAAAFERYNLITAPVVDENNRLVGRITIDDVVDVIRDEAGHSVMAAAGLRDEEDIFAPVGRSARNRSVWLGVNLLTAILASWVIGLFEGTIQQLVALAVLMPIVASMGGNAGIQTVTLVVRGIALGVVTDTTVRRVLVRELMVGVLNSVIWAMVIGVITVFWFDNIMLGVVIGLAMVINLIIAALAGVVIPIAVRMMGIDPVLASGVALTTVTDVVGFLTFLGLAALMLM